MNFEVAHQFISFVGRDHLPRLFHAVEHLGKNPVVVPVNIVIIVFYNTGGADIRGHKNKHDRNGDIKCSILDFQVKVFQVRIRNDRAQNKAKSDGKRHGYRSVHDFERNAQTKRFRSEYKQKKNKFVTLQKAGADKYDKADDEQREKRTFSEQRR